MIKEVIKKDRFIPLWFDAMFKKVFGNEEDKRPLKYLLKLILGVEIKDLKILNSEILGESIESKKTTVDLIVTLEDGKKVGIEMNQTVSQEIIDRNLIYMFRIMANSLRHSEGYEQLDKHIQINFDMEGYHERPIEIYKIINIENISNVLTDKLEIICIDVPYFTNKCYNEEELSEQDRLIGLIGMTDRSKVEKVIGENDIMGEIIKKIKDFSEDEKMAAMYDYDFHLKELARIAAKREAKKEAEEYIKKELEKITKYKEEIRIQAEEEVAQAKELAVQAKEEAAQAKEKMAAERDNILKQEAFRTAKKMLEKNCDKSFVCEITGLSADDIQAI